MRQKGILDGRLISHIRQHHRFAIRPGILAVDKASKAILAVQVDPFSGPTVDDLALHHQRETRVPACEVESQVWPLLDVASVEAEAFGPSNSARYQLRE